MPLINFENFKIFYLNLSQILDLAATLFPAFYIFEEFLTNCLRALYLISTWYTYRVSDIKSLLITEIFILLYLFCTPDFILILNQQLKIINFFRWLIYVGETLLEYKYFGWKFWNWFFRPKIELFISFFESTNHT